MAIEVARAARGSFADGAWFVPLAPVQDPELVANAVARALGLKEEPSKSLTQTLTEHLKHKRLLLLLDNCEHLLDACAGLANAFLRQCPDVKILATSREALGITGEQTYRVPSLSLPDRKLAATPQSLSPYESVQLFIDRALLVCPEFQVTNKNAPALASLRSFGSPRGPEGGGASTSQGQPYAIFQLALKRRNVLSALAAAKDLPQLGLAEALELTVLVARNDLRRHQRVASRWLLRYSRRILT